MKIPKRINICGVVYTVASGKRIVTPDGTQAWGHIDFGKGVIQVDEELSPEKQAAVFLHEIIHGIDEAISIGLSEENTDRLAHALLDTITRNKLDLND